MLENLYEEISFNIPEPPKKENIHGYLLDKKEQKWRRNVLPNDFDEWTEENKEQFILTEFERRTKGYWFYNNGVPTYITGHHYFYLNWCQFGFGYPNYRDVDRRSFYFWQVCEEDEECLGEIQLKFRRRGATSQAEAIILNTATMTFNAWCGIVSKTGKDAQDVFSEIVDLYRNLPEFFQPVISDNDRPKVEMYFAAPAKSAKKGKVKRGIELNTRINWRNSVENAYDGRKLKIALFDEQGKAETMNAERFFDIHKPCFMQGRNIIGKAMMPTTVNEMSKGGSAFKKTWESSDYSQRTENARTISGLYRYFVPAFDGYEGYIDEYGMSIIEDPEKPLIGIDGKIIKEGAKSYLEKERKAREKDRNKLAEFKRQFPFSAEEALRTEGQDNMYDLEKIYEQIDHNNLHGTKYRTGNFIWKNGQRDSVVEFQEDERGKWNISWMPELSQRNNKKFKNGKPSPGNEHQGLFGCDPFDNKFTASNKKSNGASYGYLKYDAMIPMSEFFVCEYVNRPHDPNVFYEDMLMQCVFYGWEMLVENNKYGIINYFDNRGYTNYLMERPNFTHTEYSEQTKSKNAKGIPMTGESARGSLMETTQAYIYNKIGYNDDGNIGVCHFNKLLECWAKFEPDNWTDYDEAVAAGLALIGSKKYSPKKEIKKINIFDMFPKYDNRGNISKKINSGNASTD